MFNKGPERSLTECQPEKWQEEFLIVGVIIANEQNKLMKKSGAAGKLKRYAHLEYFEKW